MFEKMRMASQNEQQIETKREEPRTPQRRRGRERVAALMAAGAAVFIEKGFDAATMTEIAARAGGSIGSLYLFFPTKEALAQGVLEQLAEELSGQLEALEAQAAGRPPEEIADALFDVLASFLAAHPVYAALLDLPGGDAWRREVRKRRRSEIAALFARAEPPLPPGRIERLAVIVPQLMRIPLVLEGERVLREGILDELRAMLRLHLRELGKPGAAA